MIRSVIAGNAELDGYDQRQAIFAGIGLVVIMGTTLLDYHFWATLARPMYVFVMGLLIVIFILGQARFGAARWLDTGLVLIQPAEIAKITMILVLADFFSRSINQEKNLRWIIRSLLLTGGMVIWILLQPNLSTSIVIFVLWGAMLWISGLPTKFIGSFLLTAVIGIAVLFPFLEPYQQGRVISFIFPDPNATQGEGYNVEQAAITIGSGGWLGMGYGNGSQVQLRFLKVRHTDFIFSAMAEEFGFVGTVLVISVLVFVILRCIRAARLAGDTFGSLVAYGFAILLFFQTAVNIGVNLNVIPVTGLTLPFISYGGSSLVSLLLGIGLVESVVSRRKPLEF
jgi:rod shape determining protein RodA